MTYVLAWTNPSKTPITLADGTKNITSTSLILTGKGYVGWGFPMQENILHLLENFANPTPPSTFTLGQTWYDSAHSRLTVNVGPSGTNFLQLAFRNIAASTAPLGPVASDLWYDTTAKFLNVYGSSWNQLAYNVQVQGNYSADSGTANTYVVALTPPITTYSNNFAGSFKAANANSGASTIAAFGGPSGPVPLVNNVGGPLVDGDIPVGAIVPYIYVLGDDKAYVTSVVQSQTDARYAQLGGLDTQTFEVATASDANDAVPLAQAQIIGVPVGTIIDFAGNTAPTNYIACPTGPTLVSITGPYYPLYEAIGTAWGTGSGTFGLPYFPAQYAAVQTDSSGDIGTPTHGQVLDHIHNTAYEVYNNSANIGLGAGVSSDTSSVIATTNPTNGPHGPDNLAAGMRVMKCVKYTN